MEQQANDRQETDNSRLARAKRKLERLKREYSAQISRVFDHQAQTNGQPMNDKANGRSFFNRQEQLEDKARTLLREIEAQEERISTLEYQKERKALGLNKQGGLIMSVDNIPMIKAEIEQAKQGNSMYSAATIRKYEKQLVELEELKRRSERADKHMNEQAQKMIESGRLTQWKKNPMIYFVKGYRKLAIELTESGTFESSQRYAAKTESEQSVISDILNELTGDTIEVPNATKDQEAALNHFYRVEFNEGSESIRNFEGEIVSQPLIEEIKRLDRPMESGYYKFYFQEIKDGEIVDAFRLDVGDGVNSNQDYYKKLESLAAKDKKDVLTNDHSKADYYLRIENHAEGAFFRIYTDEENIFKSTVASYEFDLHAQLTEENIWFSQDHKEAEEKLNADFLVNDRLNPKYLSSFISQWNDYKKQNNVYMGVPIDHGLIEFDPSDYYKGTAVPLTQGKLTIVNLDTQKKVEPSEEKRSVKKRKSADELKKETDQLVKDAMENIKNHFDDPEDVLELGAFMSKFYNYSLKNTALIQKQLPHAHAVAGAKKFKEAGFFIRKGFWRQQRINVLSTNRDVHSHYQKPLSNKKRKFSKEN
ncbi:hypothetical protein [Enterococcus innesii]|uniref:hypothetical protein n=1 Tax=Enterococcus innesii TaxID=2839759 RepID=UPI001FCBDEF7|nr:hypothetical protein [Enterococcus innesii]